ncbi:hypothetical protein [Legionella pneumophila]|uniref:Uncharacterized protein n=1 Tax=Legionella pneumophila subsp. pascullei TaxID=91890 RepID=A0AAX2IXR6_LEGPN|nr:hypothetical protein [Legionella pneumophila]AMP89480.1 hypothetical protein AXF35_07220 [Legionella pneumophila subsp. pascullei]AMP92853.1 hypothetical protein AXF36_09580 [Legionella pneumophila subsp. pascullei]AMP95819.1 hypothetical protein AXF37_09470 [Legionella pneumophila subsp. pascullei]SQG90736.1 Uncharacterised protein [Legionella pneumophila subsp. pascullei]VEH07281.1 Uncharacterised protein [Legionella pneumophila subsp. pascullei]
MNTPKWNLSIYRAVIFIIALFASMICAGAHFVGGIHTNAGYVGWYHPDSYHNDVINVGNYHPGYGWVAPVYATPAYFTPTYIINDVGYNCQTVQQCDSDGNCIQTQNCD